MERRINPSLPDQYADKCFEDARKLLADTPKLLDNIMNSMGDGLSIQDRNMRIVFQNKFMIDHFGSHIGDYCYEIYERRNMTCDGCPIVEAFRTGNVVKALRVGITREGTSFRFENIASPLRNDQDEIVAGMELCRIVENREKAFDDLQETMEKLQQTREQLIRDISERVRLEERLREAYNETENFLASISSILIGLTLDHRVTRWNVVAEKTLGLSREGAVGRPLEECPVRWEWSGLREALGKSAATKQTIRLNESRYLTLSGKEGFLRLTVSPILKDNNELTGFLVHGADITERRILEAQLVQAQKLESIGQLAAGIAHEINTPTQYVGDNIQFLQDSFTDLQLLLGEYQRLFAAARSCGCNPDLTAEIEAVARQVDIEYLQDEIPLAISQGLDGVERVSKIVRAMKSFSHPGTEEKSLLDINQALESTITVASNEWKYAADLETEFDPDLPQVLGLPAELNQVFLNIIINAAHAISDVVGDGSNGKGLITVRTGAVDEAVEIHISDTGTGIPAKIRDRIFDPFYTTKEVGRGTGQGLAIARSVVADQHGGTITVESEVGTGTTFIIRLPVASAQGE